MTSTCSNCGKSGHFFRECTEPITSLGIIAFRRPSGGTNTQWLLIRRRVSIGYIEIMRGKYDPRDAAGIQALVDQATVAERQRLITGTFPILWRDLWNGPVTKRYSQEYEQARTKFEALRSRGTLTTCCSASKTTWTEPEWGFPKGRRSTTETELECALRETEEEAGVKQSQLRVMEGGSITEEYRGSNSINYRHRYWLAEAPPTLEVRMDPDNPDQAREISDVRWCSLEEALDMIRPYCVEKKAALRVAANRVEAKFGVTQQRR
jgi:8-oxo-dGTP pyrophosphatase MutT (NUDIX family)